MGKCYIDKIIQDLDEYGIKDKLMNKGISFLKFKGQRPCEKNSDKQRQHTKTKRKC